MRSLILRVALLLVSAGVVDGLVNSCLDPDSAGYLCQEGTTRAYFIDCDLTDDDMPDMANCLDVIGRDNIERLYIDENADLTTLPADLFQGLPELLRLSLGNNNLQSLPTGVFDGLGKVERLYLRHNKLPTLPEGLFKDLGGVVKLLLNDNKLAVLPPGIFDGLGNLLEMHLEANELTTLPKGLFNDVQGLAELYLSRNYDLQCVPDTKAVVDVELPGDCECTPTEAVQCDEGFECAPGPSGYSCGYNACFDADSASYKCQEGTERVYFTECDLADEDIPGLANCLDEIGRDSIERLYIDNNADLTMLPTELFQGLPSLLRLSVTENSITALPSGLFDGLGKVERLYLRHNQLTTLPEGLLNDLAGLDKLFLYDNNLISLPAGTFGGLGNLVELHLESNDLTTLPKELFSPLGSLQQLFIRRNLDLQCIPDTNAVVDVDLPGDCECTPAVAVECDNGYVCVPGSSGYTCESATHRLGGDLHMSDMHRQTGLWN